MPVCPDCGGAVEPGDTFCGSCGARLDAVDGRGGSPEAEAEPEPVVAEPAAQRPVVSRPVRRPAAERPSVPEPLLEDGLVRDAQLLASEQPNAAYLGQRLQFQTGAETFDISQAVFAAASLRTSAVMALIFFVVPGVPGWYLVYATLGSGLSILYLLVLFAVCFFIWISPLFRRHYFCVSEWKLSIDGKGESAERTFEHIAEAVVRRAAPLQYRVITLPDAQRYLNLRLASYDAYITCMPFGHDLYIGWTLWASGTWREMRDRSRSLLVTLLALPYWVWVDIQASRSHSSFDVARVHEFDVVKAMRECLHAVTREGVDAAVGAVEARGAGTIGSEIPEGRSPEFAGKPMSLR